MNSTAKPARTDSAEVIAGATSCAIPIWNGRRPKACRSSRISRSICIEVETAPWARTGVPGAFVHLKGRGDFMSLFVIDLPPGGKTSPQQHLYEEVIYVLSGHGSTKVEIDGKTHSFEWGPNSLFALPLNVPYQHFNASGTEKARLISANNLTAMMNQFYDEDFIFNNPAVFQKRIGKENYFQGEGEMWRPSAGASCGRPISSPTSPTSSWKPGTGAAPKAPTCASRWPTASCMRIPRRCRSAPTRRATATGPDFHVLTLKGEGYSLFWREGDKDFIRIDWKPGVVFAPVDQIFHQHFNTSPYPARYLALAMGSLRYPLTAQKRQIFLGVDQDVKQGGAQIEYEDQDPRIHKLFLQELQEERREIRHGRYIDERRSMARKLSLTWILILRSRPNSLRRRASRRMRPASRSRPAWFETRHSVTLLTTRG